MKSSTKLAVTAILAVLREVGGLATTTEVMAKTSLNINQVNGVQGIWTNSQSKTKPLWETIKKDKHTFLKITEEGKNWKPLEAPPARAAKKTMTEDEAREALLAEQHK